MKRRIAFLFVLILPLTISPMAKSQENLDAQLCRAVDYALNFEYENALTLLDKLMQENPEDVRTYLFKAVVYVQFLVNCKNVEKNEILFFENIDRAEEIVKKLEKKNKDDWFANFFWVESMAGRRNIIWMRGPDGALSKMPEKPKDISKRH